MMRSHERIEELIAIRSIGGLDPQEQAELEREMASHGFDCEGCYLNGVNTWANDHASLYPGDKTPGITATLKSLLTASDR